MIKKITKKFLIENYIKKNKSACKIAKSLQCSVTPIYKRLYNMPIKNRTHYKHTKETKKLMSILASKRTGRKASNFKDGRYIKQHYCIICGNIICADTWIYGSRKCNKCAKRGN